MRLCGFRERAFSFLKVFDSLWGYANTVDERANNRKVYTIWSWGWHLHFRHSSKNFLWLTNNGLQKIYYLISIIFIFVLIYICKIKKFIVTIESQVRIVKIVSFQLLTLNINWCGGGFIAHLLKVENILKGSLNLISSPSPSVKIQIMISKVCLRCKGKTLLGIVKKLWKQKVCWHHPTMFCLITTSKLFHQ